MPLAIDDIADTIGLIKNDTSLKLLLYFIKNFSGDWRENLFGKNSPNSNIKNAATTTPIMIDIKNPALNSNGAKISGACGNYFGQRKTNVCSSDKFFR